MRQETVGALPGEEGLIDGFPTSAAADALAAECALVSANPRGEHWILRPDEHYPEVPSNDPGAVADPLRALAADRDARDALAERGPASIREVIDVHRVAAAKLAAMGLLDHDQGQ